MFFSINEEQSGKKLISKHKLIWKLVKKKKINNLDGLPLHASTVFVKQISEYWITCLFNGWVFLLS